MPRGRHGGGGGRGGGRGGGGRGRGGGGGGGGDRGDRGGGGGRGGRGRGGGRPGKLSYDAGAEPAFIRQFKERTGYKAPATAEDKRRVNINDINDPDPRPRDGDYRNDDERPQIVQLDTADLTKEEVDMEMKRAKEAEEERKCVDATGRLLFRRPKEKSEENESTKMPTGKSEIVEIASNKTVKRKQPVATTAEPAKEQGNVPESKKAKTQLLSFMNESGIDGDD